MLTWQKLERIKFSKKKLLIKFAKKIRDKTHKILDKKIQLFLHITSTQLTMKRQKTKLASFLKISCKIHQINLLQNKIKKK